ncbi:MAG: ferritin-like domain-containing protein [Actinomycetota bacterium]|nr:ferritin-like domain-containing protein [Actinomycetota bacterium]
MTDHTVDNHNDDATVESDATDGGIDRRRFLVAGGVAAGAVVAATSLRGVTGAAASTARTRGLAPPVARSHPAQGSSNTDATTAAFAASLEVLAVGTYKAALDAATAGALGPVPPAGAMFVQTAMSQHQAQLDKWNSTLQSAGQQPVMNPDPKLKQTVDQQFGTVTDFSGAAKLARMLEQIAAATYLKAIPTLKSADAIQLAGSIQIIDMQHVAILNYVLGEYPVPDVFAKTDQAAKPS